VADFNGDGLLDLVTANQTDNTVSVLLGKGDGTFQPRATTAVGVEPVALVAGDFNGDGLPDLAVVDSGETSPGSAGSSVNANVEILINQVTATATLSNVSVAGGGLHLVDATYAGDANNAVALSTNTVSLVGTQVPTALTVSSSVSTVAYGQQVMLTAKLTPYSAGNISTNAESIIFQSNGANVGIGSLASGVAVLNVTNLPIGTDNLTAVYGGDSTFITSISAATTVNVQAQVPTLVFAPIANVSTSAAPFTVSASSASPGAITYAVTSGPATLSGSTVTVTGAGTVVLSATQAATANYAAATATTSFTVTAAAPVDFTMVAGAATLSQIVYPGGAATYVLQVAPTGSAYPDNVTFTATGVPIGASYSFSPAIVPANNGPATVSFTVQTATGQASNGDSPLRGFHSRFAPVALGLLLLPFAGMRRLRKARGKAVLPFCVWLMLLVGTVSLTGCGGATENLKNYNITVTATSGTVQHSTTVSMQLR
jgi:hypothetical protein